MKTHFERRGCVLLAGLVFARMLSFAAPGPGGHGPANLDTPRTFPVITSAKQWQDRAREIRQQVLVSCGLWPLPQKTPVQAHIFGKVIKDGYSIEKVYFETWPGLYLGGNLYRPVGRGDGPFPAILNPHGHWANGRMADNKDGSIAGRCLSFARQGMIAFSYDMIGYNDTHFADSSPKESFSELHHEIATNRADLLWNISLMGLQTWDSIRALDFLESLPDADPKRLACTGESGGGTQTFMLGSVEDRLAAQAPVVMVSHIMQGGCLCENAPGLRVEYSNMEIDAAAAPRPQILVAATGDWTKDTLTVEGPSIAHIYELLHARDRFHYVRFNFDHNYNQTSREAVYDWFGKWLLHAPDPSALKEQPFHKEPDADLRVFPGNQLPDGALTLPQFLQSVRELHRRELRSLAPSDPETLKRFQAVMLPAWRHTLLVDWPMASAQIHAGQPLKRGDFTEVPLQINRANQSNAIACTYWAPPGILNARSPKLVVLLSNTRAAAGEQNRQAPPESALPFLKHDLAVLTVDAFSSGPTADPFKDFYCTYNRTELQEHVRDLLTICAAAKSIDTRKTLAFRVTLCGGGRAGLWALLAAPAAQAVIADCDGLDTSDETALLAPDLFCPGILALGGFEGVASLAAPRPMLLHNTGSKFSTEALKSAYAASGIVGKIRIAAGVVGAAEQSDWAARL